MLGRHCSSVGLLLVVGSIHGMYIYIYTIVYWICVYLCMFIGDIYCIDMRLSDISIIIYQMNISYL